MADFSIRDVILGFKKEAEVLAENWQGDSADVYQDRVMSFYISYANAIEKCLQEINQELEVVRSNLDDNPDSVYNHPPKKIY